MACEFSMCKTVGCYLFLLTAEIIYLATLKFLILKIPVPVSNLLPGLRQVRVFVPAIIMPQYQLEIAIALNVSTALSALLLYLNRSRSTEGKIRLPLHDAPHEEAESEETYPDGDPFDITTAEDILDGYPLHEEKFWA
ncbi:hypothetical protein B0H13DRAFT_2372376 [Mycena leptocephala]|nr:hypothetical protein B0H13DRAFT_2372376 [Mycena leptocephala]